MNESSPHPTTSLDATNPESELAAREPLRSTQRLVVKVGTRVLTSGGRRFDRARLDLIVQQIAPLVAGGREILLVSSGAVALGAELLGLAEPPERLEDRQACAAVGQAHLIQTYQESLRHHGLLCAQVLLTESDFVERRRYLNLRATLQNLLRRGVIPVINENDTVSVDELVVTEQGSRPVFGDNDRLSALVATKLDAQLLVIITDVGGLYDRDPKTDPTARLLDRIEDPEALTELGGAVVAWGRGGIRTKMEAAQLASRAGCHVVIASAGEADQLARILAGEVIGSWFPARDSLGAYKRWLAFATRSKASLFLDQGAVDALRFGRRSLLAAGVRRVEGSFARGDVVELRTLEGRLVGRGMANCDVETARRWGAENTAPRSANGARSEQPLVRRERMVLEEWASSRKSAQPADAPKFGTQAATDPLSELLATTPESEP
jgi:glutamate 5-kinase